MMRCGRQQSASALRGLLLAAMLLAAGAQAGDEDISPNAYQEFDPVTGYMVTVDPDAEGRGEHPPADVATHNGADEAPADAADEPVGGTQLAVYLAAFAVFIALFFVWIRVRSRQDRPL